MKVKALVAGLAFFVAMCVLLYLALKARGNLPLVVGWTVAAAACFFAEAGCFFSFLWGGGDEHG